jgi:hypothetical protein
MRAFAVGLVGSVVLGLVMTPFEPSLFAFMVLLGLAAGAVGRDLAGAAWAAAGTFAGLAILFVADLLGLVMSFWSVRWEDFSDPEFPGLLPLILAIPVGLTLAEVVGYAVGDWIARRLARRGPMAG